MKVENWYGYDIRFVEINGEWWAILKDICDALNLKTKDVSQRVYPEMLERVLIERDSTSFETTLNIFNNPSKVDGSDMVSTGVRYEHQPVKDINSAIIGKDIGRKPGEWKTHWMLAVNELGIYEALFASRRLEARKFRLWAGSVMQKLRQRVGLQQYEVMQMTDPKIQEEIDWILDSLYWDDEKKCVMQSVTVQGGDVIQKEFI